MTMDLNFPIGTVSHGTLRHDDLFDAAQNAAKYLADYLARANGAESAKEFESAFNPLIDEWNSTRGDETRMELLMLMEDILTDYCPPFTYYGSHIGDGSDFGFWPCDLEFDMMDECELECFDINDHGNVTLYDRNKKDESARIVWAIV